MVKYILKRIIAGILSMFVLITITFFLMHAIPGGPFSPAEERKTPPDVLKKIEARYGLDKPVPVQYIMYLKRLLKGDLGMSFKKENTTVNELIETGFPVSARLGLMSVVISLIIGIPLGIISAIKRGKWMDWTSMIFATIGISIPSFVISVLLMFLFSVKLKILPTYGLSSWAHYILPVFCLAFSPIAYITRLMRSSMLEVMRQDYIRTARSKGVREIFVIAKHGLRNSIMPIVTYLGPLIAGLLTGSFVIERLFSIPGIGRYFVSGISDRDYSVTLGLTIFFGGMIIICNLVADTIDIIIHDGFIMSFDSEADLNRALPVVEQFIYVKDYSLIVTPAEQIVKLPERVDAVVPQTQTNESDKSAPAQNNSAPAKQSLINVNLTKLDKLMDLVGEIVISESRITAIHSEGEGNVDVDNFAKATRQLTKLTDELQEIVMSIRMVPVSGVFQKMNRIVRDMSKKLGKDVELVLIGEETEVDKNIVDNIGDPLMHLVRNAMDHGIEDEATRLAAGKPASGRITLSAQNTGGEILIIVQDDGKGMDPAQILKKAKEAGLATKNETDYTQKEILSFLLMPGFSTKDVATEFSGRGVGMDVVKKNVEKVGGDVSLESKLGEGSMVIFKIPLSLSIVKGMEVSVANSVFTIPINNIRSSFKADETNIMYDSNMREIVMLRNEYYPVIRLHELYDIETEITDIKNGILILVEADEKTFCIFADALRGEHQVVVKPIPIYLNKYNVKEYGIGGCAILGNGSITLILDMMNLGNNL